MCTACGSALPVPKVAAGFPDHESRLGSYLDTALREREYGLFLVDQVREVLRTISDASNDLVRTLQLNDELDSYSTGMIASVESNTP